MIDPGALLALTADYVARVNARDADALAALFAPDAVLRHPVGVFDGREAIRQFYVDLVFAGQAVVTLGRVAVDGDVAFFALTATSELDPGGAVIETVDVMRADEGGAICELDVYAR